MQTFRLRLLGGTELTDATGRPLDTLLRQPKRLSLVAHLVLCPAGAYARRDKVVALFWPELDSERARHSLRQSLYFIRQCTNDLIEARGAEEIRIDRSLIRCDVWEFEEALASDRLHEAQALYRGDLLDGVHAAEVSSQLEQRFETRRQQLRERAASAAWELAERAAEEGDDLEVHHWGRRAIELSPEVESAYRRLIELLNRIGDSAAAVEAHRSLEARLEGEIGVRPSPETTRLIEHVRRGARSEPAHPTASSFAAADRRTAEDDGPQTEETATVTVAGLDRAAFLAAFLLFEIAILALALLLA